MKAAADQGGKPIYLELSSINPVVLLPGALAERGEALVQEITTSALMGTGQFCTNPGLLLCVGSDATERMIEQIGQHYRETPPGTLLSAGVESNLCAGVTRLCELGATLVTNAPQVASDRFACTNTLLRLTAQQFLAEPAGLQDEVFGNVTVVVVGESIDELVDVIKILEGNLTGSIYAATNGGDDDAYRAVASVLTSRVGRLMNDKMPTGVAVSPAMNHGGPYPATGHPGFTAVGIPASLRRFAALRCYDQVRPHHLPAALRDAAPNATMWRLIDLAWRQG